MLKRRNLDKFKYKKAYKDFEELLKDRNIIPETELEIYPLYPIGWRGIVGAYNRIYIFTVKRGNIDLEIQPVHGFRKNGRIIIK